MGNAIRQRRANTVFESACHNVAAQYLAFDRSDCSVGMMTQRLLLCSAASVLSSCLCIESVTVVVFRAKNGIDYLIMVQARLLAKD